MPKLIRSTNNTDGGICQVCRKQIAKVHEIWNTEIEHNSDDRPELTICGGCLEAVISLFIDES